MMLTTRPLGVMCAYALTIITSIVPTHSLADTIVQPVDSQVATGKTYGEWSANWWQYVLSIPSADNPLLDTTGVDCAFNQNSSSPVFFLVGSIGGNVTRSQCVVPGGKVLFFPILNDIYIRTAPNETEDLMRNRITGSVKAVSELHVAIDGVPVSNLGALYRTVSPSFYITLPEGNLFGAPSRTYFAVADGFYLMVSPLSAGTHTINFGGKSGSFTLDDSYDPLTAE